MKRCGVLIEERRKHDRNFLAQEERRSIRSAKDLDKELNDEFHSIGIKMDFHERIWKAA